MDKFRDIVGTKLPLFPTAWKLRSWDFDKPNQYLFKSLKNKLLSATAVLER